MFKDSYKIIFIKEGKYNFKQLNFKIDYIKSDGSVGNYYPDFTITKLINTEKDLKGELSFSSSLDSDVDTSDPTINSDLMSPL